MKRGLDVVVMLLSILWMFEANSNDQFGWFLVAACTFLIGFLMFVADTPSRKERRRDRW